MSIGCHQRTLQAAKKAVALARRQQRFVGRCCMGLFEYYMVLQNAVADHDHASVQTDSYDMLEWYMFQWR